MPNILVVGSLNMDLVALTPRIPVAGETLTGSRFFTVPGGKGANQAYAAAKLGSDVAMLGCTGDDDFGRQMRANLSAARCNISAVRTVPGSSGAALICVSDAGENSIVVIPGANAELQPTDIAEEAELFASAGILLLQLETPIESVTAAAIAGRSAGARVILDPAPAPSAALPIALCRAVSMVTPNETEACLLAGLPPAPLSHVDAESVARRIQALGVSTLIIKLGAQGCLLRDGDRTVFSPAPNVKAVDTTGAGDIFNGALAVALSAGAELEAACRVAVNAAALSVTRFGAQASAPTREEVEAFGKIAHSHEAANSVFPALGY